LLRRRRVEIGEHMTRQTIAALCAVLLVTIVVVSAHAQYRIIGTVLQVSDKSLAVKQTKDGKTISMEMDNESIVTRDKKKVNRAEIKIGRHVVVDACGDSVKDLLVMEVRIVPAPEGFR
jgi:hypothetical protein